MALIVLSVFNDNASASARNVLPKLRVPCFNVFFFRDENQNPGIEPDESFIPEAAKWRLFLFLVPSCTNHLQVVKVPNLDKHLHLNFSMRKHPQYLNSGDSGSPC